MSAPKPRIKPKGDPHRQQGELPNPDTGKPADQAQKEKIQRQLDEALADSFPASDPVSIVTSHEEEDWGKG